ncbi:MAG: response regulator [Opitutaceae bacterium]|nr:response regulator [Opitutaceae bacterium]
MLIVDDEEAVRTLVRVLVERRGAQALLASDGVEALELYAAHSAEIGVILTDIHMPNLNGLGLIRALQAKVSPPPIVVMCGQLDERLLATLTAEHVACVLHKPFQISEFEAVLALLPAPAATA